MNIRPRQEMENMPSVCSCTLLDVWLEGGSVLFLLRLCVKFTAVHVTLHCILGLKMFCFFYQSPKARTEPKYRAVELQKCEVFLLFGLRNNKRKCGWLRHHSNLNLHFLAERVSLAK